MADIFLSYANEDREMARTVAGLLESAGCTVWWDRRIPAGRTWRSMIEEALRDMRCMVVLWSSHSVDSDWVKEEAEEARALGKLIPVIALRPGKIAVVARWGGIESLAAQIVVRESPIKASPEPPTYKPAVEPPQVTPAKPPVQTINVGSYVNRAKGYRVQGDYAAALAELEKARVINPSQEVIEEIEATRRACNAEKRLGREGLTC